MDKEKYLADPRFEGIEPFENAVKSYTASQRQDMVEIYFQF